jgi:hypothetical protein
LNPQQLVLETNTLPIELLFLKSVQKGWGPGLLSVQVRHAALFEEQGCVAVLFSVQVRHAALFEEQGCVAGLFSEQDSWGLC